MSGDVTNDTVLRAVEDVGTAVDRLATSLETIGAAVEWARARFTDMEARIRVLEHQQASSAYQPTVLADLEARMRATERWRYAIPIGAAIALVSAITALMTKFG